MARRAHQRVRTEKSPRRTSVRSANGGGPGVPTLIGTFVKAGRFQDAVLTGEEEQRSGTAGYEARFYLAQAYWSLAMGESAARLTDELLQESATPDLLALRAEIALMREEPGWADLLGRLREVAPDHELLAQAERGVVLPPGDSVDACLARAELWLRRGAGETAEPWLAKAEASPAGVARATTLRWAWARELPVLEALRAKPAGRDDAAAGSSRSELTSGEELEPTVAPVAAEPALEPAVFASSLTSGSSEASAPAGVTSVPSSEAASSGPEPELEAWLKSELAGPGPEVLSEALFPELEPLMGGPVGGAALEEETPRRAEAAGRVVDDALFAVDPGLEPGIREPEADAASGEVVGRVGGSAPQADTCAPTPSDATAAGAPAGAEVQEERVAMEQKDLSPAEASPETEEMVLEAGDDDDDDTEGELYVLPNGIGALSLNLPGSDRAMTSAEDDEVVVIERYDRPRVLQTGELTWFRGKMTDSRVPAGDGTAKAEVARYGFDDDEEDEVATEIARWTPDGRLQGVRRTVQLLRKSAEDEDDEIIVPRENTLPPGTRVPDLAADPVNQLSEALHRPLAPAAVPDAGATAETRIMDAIEAAATSKPASPSAFQDPTVSLSGEKEQAARALLEQQLAGSVPPSAEARATSLPSVEEAERRVGADAGPRVLEDTRVLDSSGRAEEELELEDDIRVSGERPSLRRVREIEEPVAKLAPTPAPPLAATPLPRSVPEPPAHRSSPSPASSATPGASSTRAGTTSGTKSGRVQAPTVVKPALKPLPPLPPISSTTLVNLGRRHQNSTARNIAVAALSVVVLGAGFGYHHFKQAADIDAAETLVYSALARGSHVALTPVLDALRTSGAASEDPVEHLQTALTWILWAQEGIKQGDEPPDAKALDAISADSPLPLVVARAERDLLQRDLLRGEHLLQQALSVHGASPVLHELLGRYALARAGEGSEAVARAGEHFNAALKVLEAAKLDGLPAARARVLYGLARVAELNFDQTAPDKLRAVLEIEPQFEWANIRLAILTAPADGGASAVDAALQGLLNTSKEKLSPRQKSTLQLERVRRSLAAGDVTKARDTLNEAARLDPGSPEVLWQLGQLLDDLGRVGDARTRLEAAYRLAPTDVRIVNSLVSAMLGSNLFAAARDVINAVPDVYQEVPLARAAKARNLRLAGQLTGAEAQLKAALEAAPNLFDLRLELALLRAAQRSPEAASLMEKLAEEAAPAGRPALVPALEAYAAGLSTSESSRARTFKQALEHAAGNAQALLVLGEDSLQRGERGAEGILKMALEAGELPRVELLLARIAAESPARRDEAINLAQRVQAACGEGPTCEEAARLLEKLK